MKTAQWAGPAVLGLSLAAAAAAAEPGVRLDWSGDPMAGFRQAAESSGVRVARDGDGRARSWGVDRSAQQDEEIEAGAVQVADRGNAGVVLANGRGQHGYGYGHGGHGHGQHGSPYYGGRHPQTPPNYPGSRGRHYGDHAAPHSDYYRDEWGRLRYGPHSGQHQGPHDSRGWNNGHYRDYPPRYYYPPSYYYGGPNGGIIITPNGGTGFYFRTR